MHTGTMGWLQIQHLPDVQSHHLFECFGSKILEAVHKCRSVDKEDSG